MGVPFRTFWVTGEPFSAADLFEDGRIGVRVHLHGVGDVEIAGRHSRVEAQVALEVVVARRLDAEGPEVDAPPVGMGHPPDLEARSHRRQQELHGVDGLVGSAQGSGPIRSLALHECDESARTIRPQGQSWT